MINIEFSVGDMPINEEKEHKHDEPTSSTYTVNTVPIAPGDVIWDVQYPELKCIALSKDEYYWTCIAANEDMDITIEEIAVYAAIKTDEHIDVDALMNFLKGYKPKEEDDAEMLWLSRVLNKLIVIPEKDREFIFGTSRLTDIVQKYDECDLSREELENICDNYIHLSPGDEVRLKRYPKFKGLYLELSDEGGAKVLSRGANTTYCKLGSIEKTGKHVDIEPLLAFMKGDDDEN